MKGESLHAKLKELAALLPYLPRSLRLTWHAAGQWTLLWAVLLVLQGLLPAASVYLTKLLVDSLVAASQASGDWDQVQPAIVYAALMGGVMLSTQILQSVMGWVRTAQNEHFRDYISTRIQEQAVAVDLAYYESSKYYDRMHRVLSNASTQPLTLLETLGGLVQHTITLVAVAALLLPYGVWLPVVLFVGTLPAFWVLVRYNRQYHAWWVRRTEDQRWSQYYNYMLTTSYFAPEIRLFGLGNRFKDRFADLRALLRHERLDLEKHQVWARIGAGLLALGVTAGVMVWMGWGLLRGTSTLGDLALFYRAFERGQNLMKSVLGSISQVHNNALFLGHLFEFLDQKPHVISPSKPEIMPATLRRELRLHNVSFHYPGTDRLVLRDFNLVIPAGQTVAIVGENGAGKTTLLKLLTRFYDPTSGSITFDGIDLRALPVDDFRHSVSVLFQFPVNYQATAAESIALGDLSSPYDQDRIEQAARAAGIHERIMELPQGYDTQLGMWFSDGNELSGGEWQRLAMARAFYRESPLIILDEPTSMMDSWAEAEWFDRFKELARDAAALIITHRFTIAKRADIIHVMQEGKIVESGSHEELLRQDGLYRQSWVAQTQTDEASRTAEVEHLEEAYLLRQGN